MPPPADPSPLPLPACLHACPRCPQNRRGDFLDAFLEHLVDWSAAVQRYQAVLDAPDVEEDAPSVAGGEDEDFSGQQ